MDLLPLHFSRRGVLSMIAAFAAEEELEGPGCRFHFLHSVSVVRSRRLSFCFSFVVEETFANLLF